MVVEAQKLLKEPTSERKFYQYDPKPINKTIHDERPIIPAEVSWSSRVQFWSIPLSAWQPLRHPRCEEVSREVNSYFMSEWNFPNEDAKRKFIGADFSGGTCLNFPLARNDRIHFVCTLLTVLSLIDGKSCRYVISLKTVADMRRFARRHVFAGRRGLQQLSDSNHPRRRIPRSSGACDPLFFPSTRS